MGTALEKLESGSLACSVCLEQVKDVGERSIAKLRCGHHFHLDCIGSAFNAKGSMQCPNCRQVEDGRWLYANGCRSQEDWNFEDFPSPYEDEYEVYAGLADMLHPHHELFGHFQWCPYQTNYPQFSVTLQEVDPPVSAYPDFIVNVLYGDQAPSPNSQQICPYLAARNTRLEEQLVMEMDVPNGGPLAGSNRGPQSFTVSERNGWPSQYAPHATSVGMMNDVGLTSLPNDRFRWPVSANRSDAPQPGYVGQERNSEATVSSSWHVPCPQHGFGGSSHPYAQMSTAPATARHHGSVRRHRHRGFASSSSRNDPVRQQQPNRATWGTGTSLDTTPAVRQELNSGQAMGPGGWQQQQAGSNQSYQWRDLRAWSRWYQTSGASSTPSASYHSSLVYGTGGATAAPSAGDGNYAAAAGAAAAAGYTSFDGQDVSQLRAFMPPPR